MAKLILSMDGLVLKEIELDQERITIGRRSHNDVQINNQAISGEHAVIITLLNDSFLEDLNSTNGTLVNGKPIKKRVLHHNDVITMGKYTLKFLKYLEEAKRLAEEKRIEMDTLSTGYSERKSFGITSGAGVAIDAGVVSSIGTATAFGSGGSVTHAVNVGTVSEAGASAMLRILNGSNKDRELRLVKAITSLGKPGVQVASIIRQPQGYALSHVEGAQTPSVNGVPIGSERRLLGEGDEIEISGVRMRFLLKS
jgi:pSer/pThr/pTyr-binding forkhead associated (FHA) protein